MNLKFVLTGCLFVAVAGMNYTALAQTKKTTAKPAAKAASKSIATAQEISEGKLLISKSDCMGCHNAEVKMVGPAYIAIAKMYPMTAANVASLSQKIISGGSGKWGQIPMSPHTTVTPVDAKKMVKYILSLKS